VFLKITRNNDFILAEDIYESLRIINKNPLQTERYFYRHPDDSVAFIEKKIVNSNDDSLQFFKLIHLGYGWNATFSDYWNGMLYSLVGKSWFSSKLNIQNH